jgi:hypothetical protein
MSIKRRDFLTLLGGAAAAWPFAARAQQSKRIRRVGVLMPYAANDPQAQARNAAFLQGLQQLGWTVGNNVEIDYRWSRGNEEDTRKYVADLRAIDQDPVSAVFRRHAHRQGSFPQSSSRIAQGRYSRFRGRGAAFLRAEVANSG